MFNSKIIKRCNNDHVPFLVNPSSYINKKEFKLKTFENLLNKFFGIELAKMSLGESISLLSVCQQLVKKYSNDGHEDRVFTEAIRKYFGDKQNPSAMFYADYYELLKNVFLMYQLSYAHYVLGKHYKMRGNFPRYCCGRSSRNLLLSCWEAGIMSAVQVATWSCDHSYVIVPFLVNEPISMGVVVIDPTSDQLMNAPRKKIRNNTMIKEKRVWSYTTDWSSGENLYPEYVETSVSNCTENVKYDEYIDQALKNPIMVI